MLLRLLRTETLIPDVLYENPDFFEMSAWKSLKVASCSLTTRAKKSLSVEVLAPCLTIIHYNFVFSVMLSTGGAFIDIRRPHTT